MRLQNGYSYQIALDSPSPSMIESAQRKEERASRLEAGSLSEAGSPYFEK